ncbi:nucleoside monophosphate kinase [Candidatus Daviesbacteria bacterium]|nr:nucleoside monophosphate kinase [Candidatus Daviesbacteria bacterium]
MKILLIGPQGSGKSTQAKLLAEFLKVPFISMGDIFRKISSEDSELGRRVKEILDSGQLVDDRITSETVKQRLQEKDCQDGFVVDGYPRTENQLRNFDPSFDKVFYLDVPEEEVIKRLLARGRSDDAYELIKKRLDLYYQQTQSLLDYYKQGNKLIEISGIGDIQNIQDEIKKSI